MTRRRCPPFLLVVLAAMLAAVLAAPTATATSRVAGSGSKAVAGGGHDTALAARATRALTEARTLFATKAHPRRALLRHGRDATLVLNRLGRLRGALTGADRVRADRLLARPTDGAADPDGHGYQPGATVAPAVCGPNVCVHYVTNTADAPSLTDGPDANTTPDYVDKTLALVESVRATYVGAGYKAPEPDGTLGGDNRVDIYLVNIGPAGLYGYCNSDKPFPIPNPGPYDGWAYCVFDNDYAPSEFGPANTPIENLKVTAAHEFFHAVQFAYDYYEDRWFMEATATWAEDEVFDGVNDNVQYLPSGPLGHPAIPLDKFVDLHQYGDWIFFRYLTEHDPAAAGGLPTLVRAMWHRADGSAGGSDDYSAQAISNVLTARHTSFATQFARFADANRRPGSSYSEGAANAYPKAPLGSFTSSNGFYVATLDHMTSATRRFVPQGSATKLKVTVDLAPAATSPRAIVSVYRRSGAVQTSFITLNGQGNGSGSFPFSKSSVSGVEVTLVNASTRFTNCFAVDTPYSCSGRPMDENLKARVKGAAS